MSRLAKLAAVLFLLPMAIVSMVGFASHKVETRSALRSTSAPPHVGASAIEASGDLVLRPAAADIGQHKPIVYQERLIDGLVSRKLQWNRLPALRTDDEADLFCGLPQALIETHKRTPLRSLTTPYQRRRKLQGSRARLAPLAIFGDSPDRSPQRDSGTPTAPETSREGALRLSHQASRDERGFVRVIVVH